LTFCSPESHGANSENPHLLYRLELWLQPNDPRGSGWRVLYSFDENEFFMTDILSANFVTSMSPGTFWDNVICVKHFALTKDDIQSIHSGEARIAARTEDPKVDESTWLGRLVMFNGQVKRNVGSRSEVVVTFGNEVDRIRGIREFFGINIDDGDARHIEGRATALTLPLN
jgi:hypothetical protein